MLQSFYTNWQLKRKQRAIFYLELDILWNMLKIRVRRSILSLSIVAPDVCVTLRITKVRTNVPFCSIVLVLCVCFGLAAFSRSFILSFCRFLHTSTKPTSMDHTTILLFIRCNFSKQNHEMNSFLSRFSVFVNANGTRGFISYSRRYGVDNFVCLNLLHAMWYNIISLVAIWNREKGIAEFRLLCSRITFNIHRQYKAQMTWFQADYFLH